MMIYSQPSPARLYIREWMAERKESQVSLANKMSCKQATISRLLSGQMQMTLEWLSLFASALNVEMTALYRKPGQDDVAELFNALTDEQKRQAIDYLRFLNSTKK